jgi:hypothetical protein
LGVLRLAPAPKVAEFAARATGIVASVTALGSAQKGLQRRFALAALATVFVVPAGSFAAIVWVLVDFDRDHQVRCGQGELMIYVVVGVFFVLFGVGQLVFARRIHACYRRRNEERSRWKQNPRGWSLGWARYAGVIAVIGGVFMIAFGTSQLAT